MDVDERRRGLTFGFSAYLLWGLFPLYFPLLEPTTPVEILANRIVWSMVVTLVALVVLRRRSWIRPVLRDKRQISLLGAAAVLIALNWGVYIYGVNSEQVVQTSLGYFITPLVSVLFGVVVLHERLRRTQWLAVGLGAVAVAVLTADYGGLPWIALTLAISFGTYGLIKKTLNMAAIESLAVETSLLAPFAGLYIIYLAFTGTSAVQGEGPGMLLLLMSTGVVTAIPLLLFGAAATRIPLTWMGLLQYSAPILQFVIGVAIYHETMSTARWMGFCLVWAALILMAFDSLAAVRRGRSEALRDVTRTAEAH